MRMYLFKAVAGRQYRSLILGQSFRRARQDDQFIVYYLPRLVSLWRHLLLIEQDWCDNGQIWGYSSADADQYSTKVEL